MSLDLGALMAHVGIEDVQFQRSYVRLVRQFSELGGKATAASAGTSRLDESLAQAAAAGNAAATGLGRAEQAMTGAGVSASDAAAATQAQAAATTEAGLASSKLTQALLREQAALDRLTELQASGTASARQLAAAQASLMGASDRAALATERAGKATGFTSQAWQSAGRRMLLTGGIIAAGFALAGREAAQFDAKMALVRTLAKASDEDMRSLRTAALTVGQAYGFTAGEVADAEAELVKAGISVKDIMGGALRGALTLAAAGQEDVAEATNTAAIAMTQFRLAGKDVPHIADLLAAGADKALGSVHDLSEALKYGGLAAAQAGYSIEETTGVLAEFAQSGLIGSQGGTALQAMFRNLQKPSDKAAAVIKQLGINVYDAGGQFLSASDLAGQLHDKVSDLPPAQRDAALATIFTARAVRAANILMREGADATSDWIDKVDDSGFAALQAAGKLDSLSGDLTKLKSALQEAFIGTGEDAQGPLRGVTRDVTSAVQAWNALPGPVKSGSEALIAVGGAALLAGGAMIVLLPKIAATKAAMAELGISGSRTAGILGKGGAFLAAVSITAIALGQVEQSMQNTKINADALTSSIEHLGRTGKVSGEITRAFGDDLSDLKETVNLSSEGFALLGTHIHLGADAFTHSGGAFTDAKKKITAVDDALTGLVTSGHADEAAAAYSRISDAAKEQGVSVEKLASRFPAYSGALRASAESAAEATNGVDKYGNAVGAAAKQTESATDAAKAYSDQLHAMADPLFAMNKSLGDLRDKQRAANQATRKYGADSRQAHQAQLDLASSALDVVTASKDLAGAVKDGSTSVSAAKRQLHQWVAAGLLTKNQANDVATSFGGLIDKAQGVSRELRRAAGGVRAAGRAIGFSFGDGMAVGLFESTGPVEAAATKLAQAAAASARGKKGFDSNSPSRKGIAIGGEFPEGIAKGIDNNKRMVEQASLRSAQSAVDTVKEAIGRVQGQLSSARGNAQSMSSGVSSSLSGAFDIANAPNLSAKGLLSFLSYGAKTSEKFDKLERSLIRHHLDPALVQQIAQLEANTPGAGIAAARNILAGGAGEIRGLNRLEHRIDVASTRTGQAVSGQQYNAGITRLEHKLDGLRHELAELRHTVNSVGREVRSEQHASTVRR